MLASFGYTYDGVGNKLTMTEEDGGVTGCRYDAAYRLVHVDYPQRYGQRQLRHDAAGNRLSHSADNKTVDYQYNGANQLLQMGDTRYGYDANGNRIAEQNEEGLRRYHYSEDNFLTGFDDPEGHAGGGNDAAPNRYAT